MKIFLLDLMGFAPALQVQKVQLNQKSEPAKMCRWDTERLKLALDKKGWETPPLPQQNVTQVVFWIFLFCLFLSTVKMLFQYYRAFHGDSAYSEQLIFRWSISICLWSPGREDIQFKAAGLCGIHNDEKYSGAGSKTEYRALLQTFAQAGCCLS